MKKLTQLCKKEILRIFGTIVYFLYLLPISKKYKDRTSKKTFRSILLVSEVDKKGGAAKLAYRLHKELGQKGIDSKMLVGLVTQPEKNIIPLHQRTDIFSRALHKYDHDEGWGDFFRLSSFDIMKKTVFNDTDIVHLHNLHVNYFSKFILPKLTSQKRTIWTLHDTMDLFEDYPDPFSKVGEMKTYPTLADDKREYLRNLSKRIMDNSYLTVVTPSKWLMEKAKRGIFQEKDVRLIYNGVDENIFKPYAKLKTRKELGLPTDKKLLLFSAAWGLAPGTKDSLSTLLEMYNHLKDNEDVFLIILGGNSEFSNKSISIPYISDDNLLAKYYSVADLFIYPSLWDNCPLAILENMGTGTPVITYSTGGIPELVVHMQTGYVATYNNSKDFIKGVDTFLLNDSLREDAIKLSRKVFEEKFTQTQMVRNYISLYQEILSR
jgi:glycosyltransferase involved in cell wall biosynthesis